MGMAFRRYGFSLSLLACLPLCAALAEVPAQGPHVLAAPRGPVRQAPAHSDRKPVRAETAQKATGKTAHPAHPAKVPAVAKPLVGKPAAKPAPPPDDPAKGSVTGLPLPRFAALRSDEVNMRAGPGRRYPIEWLYKRRGLPVQIDREFEVWRLVTAPDGVKGWVHEATLFGRRDFVVTGADSTLREAASETARAVAILKPGVVGRITACAADSDWCRVQVGDYRGWLRRGDFWGALPKEVIAPG
jgi:SH3-like domain-containing protein